MGVCKLDGSMMRPAIFLDRDGVINRSIRRNGKLCAPVSLEEWEILPGVTEALANLSAAGYALIVVTNQPDVARGRISRAFVESLHHRLQSELPLDAVLTCFHDDCDQCACRKPKPGLLLSAARDFNIDVVASIMIGDRWRDMEAGKCVGCKTFFIDYGYHEKQPDFYDYRVESLLEASQIILQQVFY